MYEVVESKYGNRVEGKKHRFNGELRLTRYLRGRDRDREIEKHNNSIQKNILCSMFYPLLHVCVQ